jgi:hypothetical protein
MENSSGLRPYQIEWYEKVFLAVFNNKTSPDSRTVKNQVVTENIIAVTTEQLAQKTKEIYQRVITSKKVLETYTSPTSTVMFGKVATYSIISEPAAGFVVEGDKVVRLEGAKNASVSKNLTFDASPLFTVTIATTSPFDFSTPNIVKITLKISSPFPVSACTGFAVTPMDVTSAPINKMGILLLMS